MTITILHSIASPHQNSYALKFVDELYVNNGYSNPRQYIQEHFKSSYRGQYMRHSDRKYMLKLPFVSDKFAKKLDKFIADRKLPFRVVYTKPTTIRDLFCRSRPLDKQVCTRDSCKVCVRLEGEHNCKQTGLLYRVTCNLDGGRYVGESGRSGYDRLGEHFN